MTRLPSPGDCELIVHAALRNADPQGVVMGLKLLAVQDPHRAQTLYDLILLAIDVRTYDPGEPHGQ